MAAMDHTFAPRRALAVALSALVFGATALRAQVPTQSAQTVATNKAAWTVPFTQDLTGRVKQVNLFVWTDQSPNWTFFAAAQPGDRGFRQFAAPQDGTYLFAVQSIDLQNQANPPTLDQLRWDLKVIVDRRPPSVLLRPAVSRQAGQVGVEWDVRDEYLDLRRFALDYRVEGVTDWQREASAQPAQTGSQFWEGLTAGQKMTVRLRVADKAGNETVETTVIGVNADGRPVDAPHTQSGSTNAGGRAEPFYVHSKTFSIPYSIPKIGPSGLSVFELWFTKNGGQTWEKAPNTSPAPGALPANPGENVPQQQGKMTFSADGEGLFGFLFVVRNGVGIGDPDPRPGDQPRLRVEVDTTAPTISLRAQAGRGLDVRNVAIQWSADDKNLTDRPVQIQYAEAKNGQPPAEGDWKPIPGLGDRQTKSGAFTWTIGKEGPFKFFVRAKADDKANNVGSAPQSFEDRNAIVVDFEVPQITIHGVEATTGR